MGNHNFTVKSGGGKYTTLDKAYKKFIENILQNNDESKKERLELYDLVISELLRYNKDVYFEELKYRITDGENPNQIILDIIDRDDDTRALLWFVRKRIEQYLEDDAYSRFYE